MASTAATSTTSTSSSTYSTDPALYIYTSLTSGSSHIVTATSRLETILRANRVPFKALDLAVDDKARMLWGRRAGKDENGRLRKLPGLVQEGLVLGDLVEIEEWNEYGELRMHIKIVPVDGPGAVKQVALPLQQKAFPTAAVASTPVAPPTGPTQPPLGPNSAAAQARKENEPPMSVVGGVANVFTEAMRQAGHEAAQKAKEAMKTVKAVTGVGKAEERAAPKQLAHEPSAATTRPLPHIIEATTYMQDPRSGTWSTASRAGASTAQMATNHGATLDPQPERIESMQSPTSTAWKPVLGPVAARAGAAALQRPVFTHAGSEVMPASQEDIRKVEMEQAIPEEDEA